MPTSVSIDVGSYTIKAVQAKKLKPLTIDRTVEVFNPVGTAMPTDDVAVEKLAKVIDTMFQDHSLGRTDVRLSLPEHVVSTKIISIPVLNDAELASAINWQAEQHIPIPLDELSLEYQVLYRPPGRDKNAQMRVLLVGVRKSVIDKYLEVFLRIGIEPTMLETHVLSVFRAMQIKQEDATSLVVHMGASTTDMFVVHEGELRFVYTYGSGGQVLSRTIEQAIQLDSKQAEQYKRTYGIDPNQLGGKIRDVLLPILRLTTLEMQKTMQFFATIAPGETVKRILLSGGASQLPGYVQYVTEQLGAEVLMSSPFGTATGEVPAANQTAFSVCTGLLMREL
jgi:type IV pilus assembly protein PilM